MKRTALRNLLIFAAALGAMLGVSALYMRYIQGEMEGEIAQTLQEVATQSATLIHERLDSDMLALRQIAEQLASSGYALPGRWSLAEVRSAGERNPHFSQITLAGTDGTVYGWDERPVADISGTPHYQKIMAGEEVAANVMQQTHDEGHPAVILAVPILRGGRVAGAVLGRYDDSAARRLVSARIYGGEGYQYMATGAGEIFIAHHHPYADPNFHSVAQDFQHVHYLGNQTFEDMLNTMRWNRQGYLLYEWGGMERVMSYMPVGIGDWYLLTIVPRNLVIARTARMFRQALMLSLIFLLLFLGAIVYTVRARMKGRRELEILHNAVPGAIFRCRFDERWTVLSANESFYQFLGYTPAQFAEKGGGMAAVIHPDDMEEISLEVKSQLEKGGTVVNQNRIVCADGTVKWIWIKCKLIENGSGGQEFYCVFMDITELKQMERQSAINHQRYEIVMERMQDTVLEWDVRTGAADFSRSFQRKFGFEPSTENFPETLLCAGRVPPEDAAGVRAAAARAGGGEAAEEEFRICQADGATLWCRLVMSPLRDARGKTERVIGVISDIDTQKRRMRHMELRACTDPLTQLFNRGAAEEQIKAYLEQGHGPGALMILDVDNFKFINDQYGHQQGDRVLRWFASMLLSQFRSGDIVGRIGGDEFIVLMKNPRDPQAAAEKARQILRALKEADAGRGVVSCSIGIARFPQDAPDYAELFRKADVALYHTKRGGKACFTQYEPGLDKAPREKISEIF